MTQNTGAVPEATGGAGPEGPERQGRQLPPLLRNVRVLRILGQGIFALFLVLLAWYLASNISANIDRLGITTGFGFLNQPARFPITDSDFRASQPLWVAFRVGLMNTLTVAVNGIVLATVLGLLFGIGRLSSNWLIRKLSAIYVEIFRNIPVLVVILFFFLAVFLPLPRLADAIEVPGLLVLSNRGIGVAWFDRTGDLTVFLIVLGVGVAAAVAVAIWRNRYSLATGKPGHSVPFALGIILVAIVAGNLFGGMPFEPSAVSRGDFRIEGGVVLSIPYASLLVALSVYTGSHIAEIVRASIQAVPKGQFEAASAVALRDSQRMRLIVLPQAMRIMVPPLANQYLNLIKNSSLAVAIAFPEVTRVVRIAIGNASPALQAILVLMAVYLCFSLAVSLLTNIVNWRLTRKGIR